MGIYAQAVKLMHSMLKVQPEFLQNILNVSRESGEALSQFGQCMLKKTEQGIQFIITLSE